MKIKLLGICLSTLSLFLSPSILHAGCTYSFETTPSGQSMIPFSEIKSATIPNNIVFENYSETSGSFIP